MKNIVITGANSGIGLQTAKGLYGDQHNLLIGSRSVPKNQEAVNKIRQAYPYSKGNVQSFALDLTKKASVQQFADFIKKTFKHIDILINNAGVITQERQGSELGVDKVYVANHFGHFYLTYLLFPLIRNSPQARIINVSSEYHFKAKESIVVDPQCTDFSSIYIYSKSKLANVMFTAHLASKLANNPKIKTFSLHPGVVDTGFGKEKCLMSCLKTLCCCMFVKSERGSQTSLFLARSAFKNLRNGEYYNNDSEIEDMNPIARDKVQNQRLWQFSEKLYGIKFQV